MVEYVYYSGIGAKKSQKHTVKEFLNIMNQHFGIECAEYLADVEYEPCVEYKEMNRKMMDADKYTRTKKEAKKYKKLVDQCNKHKKTVKKRRCNLDEYIKFSGAQTKL